MMKKDFLLRKGVYPYENFDETSVPPKEPYYSKLNKEGISDADYAHVQKVWEVFEIKNQGDYHDLYVQCDKLLHADVFENFRDKCIEIYGLGPAHFLSARGLGWHACLKKAGVNLELSTDIDMIMMVEEGTRGRICHTIRRYAKTNNKYMNNYDKSIESSYLMYLDANNLYGWAVSQKLLVNGFKWPEKLSTFNERFMESYNGNSDIGCFLEIDVEYPKKLFNLYNDLPFLAERKKFKKGKKTCM